MATSTIIKAGEAATVLRRLSTVDLADHLAEARAVIDEAKRRAAQIVSLAEEQSRLAADSVCAEAYRTGYEKGLEEGTAAGRKAAFEKACESFHREQENVVAMMRSAIEQVNAMKDELRVAATTDLMDFAIDVAVRLTYAIGDLRRESAMENLRRALHVVGLKTDVTVRVHPKDLSTLRTFASSVLDQLDAGASVAFVEDEKLSPGGCLVGNDRTQIDASLETQVAELIAQLTGSTADG